jgi:hypothetical protein
MMLLDWQMFVLQRRIDRQPINVSRTIANPAVFGAHSVVSGDDSGSLLLDEPFRRVDTYRDPVWRSHARLLGARGRRIAAVEIEISPWSTIETQLLLRPRAKNPYRWSGPRVRRYFTHAHRRVDDLAQLLTATTPDRDRTRRSDTAIA